MMNFALAFQSVHWPLEAPAERLAKFNHIPDKNRQLVAAMASVMDDGSEFQFKFQLFQHFLLKMQR